MDDPSVNWSKERYDEILINLNSLLSSSGYDPDTDCTFLPVSGLKNENIDNIVERSICNWLSNKRHFM